MTAIRDDEIYDDLCASLIKYAVDKIATLVGDYPTLQFFDWDTAAEAQELPDTDLLGPAGLGLTETDKMWEMVLSIGVSTCNDIELYRLRKLASKVFADFRPRKQLTVYRHDTAQPIGWAVVQGPVLITPISKQATRPLQFIQCQALLDPSVPWKQ